MRINLSRFLIMIFFITLLALIYVYQQSRIIQLAYREQKRLAYLDNLLTKNASLRYNINSQTSLVAISKSKFWRGEDFDWPKACQYVSLSNTSNRADNKIVRQKNNKFLSFLGIGSQAEAKQAPRR